MPDETSHLKLANHNQALIAHLLPTIDQYSGWIATIAFYKALHVVEAAFANDPTIRHGVDHEQRDRHLKSTSKYNKIYRHYRPLMAASMAARYMQDEVTDFSDRFTTARVIDELLHHHLHQLECSAARLLKSPETLARISDLNLALEETPPS